MSEKNESVRKYVYRVEIDTMADAKELVAISTKLKGQITLQSGNKFAVNAKSLLGVVLAKIYGGNRKSQAVGGYQLAAAESD